MPSETAPERGLRHWLRIGHGRAATIIRDSYDAASREVLFHACTYFLTYDGQCEDSRDTYLWNLIELTGEAGWFYRGLCDALNAEYDEERSWDFAQMCQLAGRFAAAGDRGALKHVYSLLQREKLERLDTDCACVIVEQDGLEGLCFVARNLGDIDPDDIYVLDRVVRALFDRDGEQQARAALETACRDDRHLANFLELVERSRVATVERVSPKTYAEVQQLIAERGRRARDFGTWQNSARTEELCQAAEDLLAESDEERRIGYLNIFRHRIPFPLEPVRLLPWVESGGDRLANATLDVLKRIRHPAIHDAAVRLLDRKGVRRDAFAALTLNFEPGDFDRGYQLLIDVGSDDYELHNVGKAIREVFEQNPVVEAEHSLQFLYEQGPCSMCRYSVVKALQKIGRFTRLQRDECYYDAESDTREFIAGLS